MSLKREDLKVGGVYVNNNRNHEVIITAIGEESILSKHLGKLGEPLEGSECRSSIVFALAEWALKPKPKKRYWLWDIELSGGAVFKNGLYLDNEGYNSSETLQYSKDKLLRKHENEFIEIEVE